MCVVLCNFIPFVDLYIHNHSHDKDGSYYGGTQEAEAKKLGVRGQPGDKKKKKIQTVHATKEPPCATSYSCELPPLFT